MLIPYILFRLLIQVLVLPRWRSRMQVKILADSLFFLCKLAYFDSTTREQLSSYHFKILYQLEQLERLRSEDTPRRPMITHTIDQFILNPKSMLLTSSYQIPSQNKVKAEKLEKFAKNLNFRILL